MRFALHDRSVSIEVATESSGAEFPPARGVGDGEGPASEPSRRDRDQRALDMDDFRRMVVSAHDHILEKVDELGELDRAIGDGDHGTTMRKAMMLGRDALDAHVQSTEEMLKAVGFAILEVDGGATGPLLGTFFLGLATGAEGGKAVGPTGLADMYEQAVVGLKRRTKARVGDKTLMDALMPAAEAARAGADAGFDVLHVCQAAANAACSGAEATQHHRARFGRAKHQGDRTIGHRDPGAVSMCVILTAFASALEQISDREQ